MITRLHFPPPAVVPHASSQKLSELNPQGQEFEKTAQKCRVISTRKQHCEILDGFTPSITSGFDSGLRFRQKLLYLENLGIDSYKALDKNPKFRAASVDSIKSVERCLYSMGIERLAFGRIFDMYPELLTCNPYDDFYPIFEFLLNDVGMHFSDIRSSIIRCPRLLICSVDYQLKPTLCFLRKLGFRFGDRNAINRNTTKLLVSSVEGTFIPKIEYMQSLGFSYEEVVEMVLRSPSLLTYSIEKNFRPKLKYFLGEMKGNLVELKYFPQFFSYSLERKIKPRHQLLVKHGFSVSLPELLLVSDGKFTARLIEMRLRSISKVRF